MKRIYKFDLGIIDYQEVSMPKGSTILCCQVQAGKLRIWANVDPNEEYEKRSFRVIGTGQAFDEEMNWRYIGTFQLSVSDGYFVGHLFEV